MEQQLLDFSSDDALAGFRLHTLEIFNWGTFHKQVWRLDLDSRNSLLTGDIGSGKSTLVDAVTTLLVPAHRVAYNKAAGADTKERSLRSYVMGYYKSERSTTGHAAKSVSLRDHNSFSVILGVFKNTGYLQEVTLAQVFWIKETQAPPERFYVVADQALSITGHFSGFGTDIGQLKKRLKKMKGAAVFDTFPKYGAAFRRRFGIDNEQALALFHQTVSMKSVGNLTDFVREHMLEPFDVTPRIDALLHHFDDLNRAHAAVLKAKQQIERLTPLVADCETHTQLGKEVGQLRECREALAPFFAVHKKKLLKKRMANLTDEQTRLKRKAKALESEHKEQMARRDDIRQAIAENGGDRLERLRADIKRFTDQKHKRQAQAKRYADLAQDLAFKPVHTRTDFDDNAAAIQDRKETLEKEKKAHANRCTHLSMNFRDLKTSHESLTEELTSLSARKSNIHARQVKIRRSLCHHLGIDENDLPFAGELIKVREDEAPWEGAAERLMHNFALSLLVPESHYRAVAAWVDTTHLHARLVYYLVRQVPAAKPVDLHPDSLLKKLIIKPDTGFYDWMEQELASRFNYACCTDIQRFHKEPWAITKKGQIKSGGRRHEKDDRRDLTDRSHYVLGWTNEAKIRTLKQQCRDLEKQMQGAGKEISRLEARQNTLQEQIFNLIRLGEFQDFSDLDWQAAAKEILHLEAEKQDLETRSDILQTLGMQLEALETEMNDTEKTLKQTRDDLAGNREKQNQTRLMADTCEQDLAGWAAMDPDQATALYRHLESLRKNELPAHTLTIESCASKEREMRDLLQNRINNLDKRISTLAARIIRAMHGYRRDYPLETREVDDAVSSGPEYRAMLDQLRADNLPEFEKRFKALLNENTIREVANFQSQLLREKETIKERIARINRSLSDIEYNPGRYIVLEAELSPDMDIRDFGQQLRACTEGALTGSEEDHYSEAKFLQVRSVIERFRGREGMVDLDRRWTKKVTDVRNWFVFAASERWKEDHTEYEHYTDSGGKSGGQKEKLAYTVLAASLAYQFGLEWGAIRSRTFRFVAIDEAFGRGSDDST
ncbi:MAG: ATP-dependent exonuclease SbcCD, C subunit-like protein, partial [Desulfotignum sp.]|nr:ATP-dependent exonuclease SbcCD, C subunit-like protein [Desulfotignum sp.]